MNCGTWMVAELPGPLRVGIDVRAACAVSAVRSRADSEAPTVTRDHVSLPNRRYRRRPEHHSVSRRALRTALFADRPYAD